MKLLFFSVIFLFNLTLSNAQCKEGDCNNGEGTMYYESGNKYKGTFKNGKKSGEGTFIYKSGAKYKGSWSNDKMDGIGTYIYADGRKYVGSFSNGKMEGKGKMYDSNGSLTEEGSFLDGKIANKAVEKDEFAIDDKPVQDNTPDPSMNSSNTPKKKSSAMSSAGSSNSKNMLKNTNYSNYYDAKWMVGLNTISGIPSGSEAGSNSNGAVLVLGDGFTSFNLGASLGYFVKSKIVVGGDLSLGYAKFDGEDDATTNISLHPFVKYFINNKFTVGGGINKIGDDYKLDLNGSYLLRLTDNISFEPTLRYYLVEKSPIVMQIAFNYYY